MWHISKGGLQANLIATGSPEEWANESHSDAKSAWLDDGVQVDDSYYRRKSLSWIRDLR
jgi:hypothetical protein